MKKFIKKSLCIVLSAAFALTCFTGCGKSSDKDKNGNTIVKMSIMNSVNENPGWLAMIDAANEVLKEQGEKIVIEADIIKTDSWDEYYTKITSNMMGKIGGTIGRIAESHMPMMVNKNQLQDLTDIKNELVASGDYYADAFKGVAEKNGKYYGLPSGLQHMVLYYNKTIIDEYNASHPTDKIAYPSGDWENASTFEEIADAAQKLSGNKKFGISAGPFLAYAGMYSKNSGGENIFDAQGNCVIDSQPFYDVYNWFERMLITDKSMPSTADTAVLDAMARFQGGNIAMIIDGVWQIHDVCKYTQGEVGVAAIPVAAKGNSSYTTTFADRFWAARTSTHPEADKKAIKALMSKKAVTALAQKQIGGLPVRQDCVSTYLDAIRETKIGDYVDVISGGLSKSINVPYTIYYNKVDQQINQKMSVWINGQMSTAEFVKFMDTTMKSGMAGKL